MRMKIMYRKINKELKQLSYTKEKNKLLIEAQAKTFLPKWMK